MDEEKITIIGGHKFFVRGDGSSGIVPNDETKEEKPPISLECQAMGVVDGSKAHKVLKKLLEENLKHEKNWKDLRKMIEDTIKALYEHAKDPTDEFITTSVGTFGRVLNMMDELEGKEDNNGNK